MRCQIPDHADVRLVHSQVHTARRDEKDVPELIFVDQPLDRRHGRAVQEGVARHQDEILPLGHLHQLTGLDRRRGQRLLDKDVLARGEGAKRKGVVGRHRSRDNHCVDRRIPEHCFQVR